MLADTGPGAENFTLSDCNFAKDTSEKGAATGTTAVATNARYFEMVDTNLLGAQSHCQPYLLTSNHPAPHTVVLGLMHLRPATHNQ